MKNILKTSAFIALAALAFALGGCREKAKSEYRYSERLVSRIYINTELSIYEGQVVAIQGRGFTAGDKAVFRSEKSEVVIPLVETTDTYAKFVVPEELERGDYVFYITRGDAEQKVCNITVWITTEFDIPDRDGFNIKGVVFCGKEDWREYPFRTASRRPLPTRTATTGSRPTSRTATCSFRCRRLHARNGRQRMSGFLDARFERRRHRRAVQLRTQKRGQHRPLRNLRRRPASRQPRQF